MNSLVRVAIQNAAAKVLPFGIGGEQLVILLNGNAPVAVDLATAELQIELLPAAIVCDRGQHFRLDQHPVHTLRSYPILATLHRPIDRGWPDAYHQVIARFVGTSREIVTFQMNRLRQTGMMTYSRKHIDIDLPAFLEELRQRGVTLPQARSREAAPLRAVP